MTGPRIIGGSSRQPRGAAARLASLAALSLLCLLLAAWGSQARAQVDAVPLTSPEEIAQPSGEPDQGDADAVNANAAAVGTPEQIEQERLEVGRLFRDWTDAAERAEKAVVAEDASTAAFEVLREVLVGNRGAARAMADKTLEVALPVRSQLEALGPAPKEGEMREGESIAAERQLLVDRLTGLEAQAKEAELVYARTENAIKDIDDLIRNRFANQLLLRGPTPLHPAYWAPAILDVLGVATKLFDEAASTFNDPIVIAERQSRLPIFGSGALIGIVLTIWIRARMKRIIVAWVGEDPNPGRKVAAATVAALTGLIVPAVLLAMSVAGLVNSQLLGPTGQLLLDEAITGAVILVIASGLALAYYSPDVSEIRLSGLSDGEATRASYMALALGVVLFAHFAIVRGGERVGLSYETLSVYNAVLAVLGGICLWNLARAIRPFRESADGTEDADDRVLTTRSDEEEQREYGWRLGVAGAYLLRLFAVASPLLAFVGYFAASRYFFVAPSLSLGLICAALLVSAFLHAAVEAYLEIHGTPDSSGSGRLRLLPVLVGFVMACAMLPLLALIWGARTSDLEEAWSLVVRGVEFGGVRISPADFLFFILVFGIGYVLTRLVQSVMATSVLPNTRMDAGGRSALVSGMGYIGVALALLAGVSATGLDLSSLAIVAGALSVGIGFGLQTIVNNFVSGIILLVERPIKVGDWIQVGGQNGTVRRVSVRATEIETFDRTTLIVPNSELVATTVTNYTHSNNLGRAILRVGVAYGSDVRQVEKILREIAEAERRALRYPPPAVLFRGFGDSSLNFELRLILRDVNQILGVESDVYYEIERRLSEAGIEIPFPQRVIHMAPGTPPPEPFDAAPPTAGPAAIIEPKDDPRS